jgi:eukaryotic-like serine/threonine-protein kinase
MEIIRALLGTQSSAPPNWRGSPPRPTEVLLPVRAVDLALARFGQVVAAIALTIGVYVAVRVSSVTGATLSAMALAGLVFYTSLHHTSQRGIGPPWLRWLSAAFEVLMPSAALWVLARTEGPAYALGSWVPAQLFAGFIGVSVLRLDPRVPLAMGFASAAAYLGVWAVAIRPVLPPIEGGLLLHQPAMQVVRAGTLALMGLGSALATAAIRRAIADAERVGRNASRLGDYELGPDIASGAMGRVVDAVYRPDHGEFRRRVALKLLHPHLATDPAYVERFRTEAEIAARLIHPNLVPAVDYGRIGESWFLAMDFVEGRTLQEVLGERRKVGRPLPARTVAWIGLQLAQGVDHAHARVRDEAGVLLRVIHRDLSPSNVLIDPAGRVRITDFGVARALRDLPALHTHTLVGKPGYVAPEILRDHVVDEHADLWSLGVMLWELLCNDRLFARDNEGATMLAVIEAPVPAPSAVRGLSSGGPTPGLSSGGPGLSSRGPGLSSGGPTPGSSSGPGLAPHWDALLGRMLDRDRAARFPTAAAVIDELERIAAVEGQVLPQDVREMLITEDHIVDELVLDETSDEIPRSALPDILAQLDGPVSPAPKAAAPDPRGLHTLGEEASNRPPTPDADDTPPAPPESGSG